jgi:hypothetical protein
VIFDKKLAGIHHPANGNGYISARCATTKGQSRSSYLKIKTMIASAAKPESPLM